MPKRKNFQTPSHDVWTPQQDSELIELREADVPYKEISRLLNRTNDACRTRYKTLRKQNDTTASVTIQAELPSRDAVLYPQNYSEKANFISAMGESGGERRPWSQNDLETLFELRNAGVPYDLCAAELKRSPESCQSKWAATDWEAQPFYDDDKRLDAAQYEIKKSEFRDKIIKAADNRSSRRKIGIDLLCDRLDAAVRRLPNIPPPAYNPNRQKSSATKSEDVMLMFSDIHIGAEHTLEETGGISAFNRTLLDSRISNLKYAVRDIVELHSKMYDLPHLHIASLGDVVAGDNSSGEWSSNYISMPIVEQVLEGVNKIKDMLSYWLTVFPQITFYGVRGNHGRTGMKGVEKDYSNYDYLCYKFLELAFQNNPRIRFVIPKTWWILAEIRGYKFLMVHGDDVKGGSFPVKKLTDFESKMMGIIKEIPDYTLAGHYHNSAELSTNHGSVLLNGSFVGGDVYSIKTIHANTRPEQTIFGINDSRGKTWKYNIDLDDEREPG